MPGDEEKGLGDIAPRKKGRWGTYVVIGAIALIVILGVTLFTGGDDKANGSPGGASPNTPVTIPQLKSSIDSLTATVDGFGGRIANLESQLAGLVAPTVTQAHIDNLQASIDSLTTKVDAIGNGTSTNLNISGGLTHWLTKDSDDDIRLHVLSAEDVTLVAEVTVFYDDPTLFSNTTYDLALSDFYNATGTKRDYTPNLIPYNTTTTITTTCSNFSLDLIGTYIDAIVEIPVCYDTTTTLSNWEYSAITFYTGSFEVSANDDFSGRIDYLPADYDTISVKLLPSLEPSGSSGDGGI